MQCGPLKWAPEEVALWPAGPMPAAAALGQVIPRL